MMTRRHFPHRWAIGSLMVIALTILFPLADIFTQVEGSPSGLKSHPKVYIEDPVSDSIAVFEFESRRIIKRIPLEPDTGGLKGGLRGMAISPDGDYAYWTGHESDNVLVIDTAKDEVVKRIPLTQKDPGNITIARDGHALYIPHYQARALTILNIKENKQRVIPLNAFPGDIAATGQGRILITSRDSNQLLVLDESTGRISVIEVGRNPVGIAITQDGTQAYVSHDNEGSVAVIDLTETPFHVAHRVNVKVAGGSAVAVGPDGKYVFVAHCCANSSVTVISVETQSVKCRLPLGPKGLDPVRIFFSPAGDEAFVINSGSRNISSFRLPCGKTIAENLFD